MSELCNWGTIQRGKDWSRGQVIVVLEAILDFNLGGRGVARSKYK